MNEKPSIQLYKEDDVLIRQGESCGEMYKLLSGNAALYLHYGEENEYFVGVIGQQKCFGEVALLTGKPSPYTVVALSDVMVLKISAEDFESFIVNNPRNAVDIMKDLANRIVMLNTNIDMVSAELAEKLKDSMTAEDITEKIRMYKITGKNNIGIFSERT
ncbi:MAG: Crp/Fnr family transcriptional regulator [Ruminiclostridium sp.]